MPIPRNSDGKPIYTADMFPPGYMLYVAGRGDTESTRGNGVHFRADSDALGETVVTWKYSDQYRLVGGDMYWQGGEIGDWVSYEVLAEATTVTPNGSNEGNCNLVDTPFGEATLVVPAAMNGTHDIVDAVPIPASNRDGYWDWEEADTGKGSMAPAAGDGGYNLLTLDIPLARFVNCLQLIGSCRSEINVPNISPKRIMPHWTSKVTLYNSGHVGLHAAWSFYGARAVTV